MSETSQKHWLNRPQAKAFFQFAFIMTLALLVLLTALVVGTLLAGEERIQHFIANSAVQTVGFLMGVLGALCAIGLWIGMLWHCVATVQRRKSVRTLWLFFLIVGNWLVAPLYYFAAYRQQSTTGSPGRCASPLINYQGNATPENS